MHPISFCYLYQAGVLISKVGVAQTYLFQILIGHTRPMCVLAARLVSEHDRAVVTILTSPNLLDKMHSEISR